MIIKLTDAQKKKLRKIRIYGESYDDSNIFFHNVVKQLDSWSENNYWTDICNRLDIPFESATARLQDPELDAKNAFANRILNLAKTIIKRDDNKFSPIIKADSKDIYYFDYKKTKEELCKEIGQSELYNFLENMEKQNIDFKHEQRQIIISCDDTPNTTMKGGKKNQ